MTEIRDFPECLDSTFAATVGVDVEQLLLDRLKWASNQVSRRLTGFQGQGGELVIDWLGQWSGSPEVGAGEDGLFCIMRDPPSASSDGGRGLLDGLALRQARRAVENGSLLSLIDLDDPVDTAWVIASINDNPQGERFDALPGPVQVAVREAFLVQQIGLLRLTYSETTPTKQFWKKLVSIRLDGLEFDVRIDRQSVVSRLEVDDGKVHIGVRLPDASGKAWVTRSPTGKYWKYAGIGAGGCLLTGLTCGLAASIAAVGTFIMADFAWMRVDVEDIEIDAEVSFVPDANGVLKPKTHLVLDADVSAYYVSPIPSGIAGLVKFAVGVVVSSLDWVVDQIEERLQKALNKYFRKTLSLRFPPPFGPVPVVGISTQTDGVLGDFLYLEAGLDAGLVGVSPPFVTQVDEQAKPKLLARRNENVVGERYGGLLLSQNLINQYVNTLWRDGAFTYTFSASERGSLLEALAMRVPSIGLDPDIAVVRLWPAVTPRTVFTARGREEQGVYATTFFDDVRLCVSTPSELDAGASDRLEFLFAGQAFTQIAFGRLDPDAGKLDLLRVADRFLDIYFDLDGLGVTVITPTIQDVSTDAPPESGFSDIAPGDLVGLNDVFRRALRYALDRRSDGVVPLVDGNPFHHGYRIPGGRLDYQFDVGRGILYATVDLTGRIAELLQDPGLVDLLDCAAAQAVLEKAMEE